MRYYTRLDRNAKVEGPFTVEALTEAIRNGRLPSDALASSDLGEDISRLQTWRRCDWFPLAAIAELRAAVPPLPEPPAKPPRIPIVTVFLYVALALDYFDRAITEQRWFMFLVALLLVCGAVDTFIKYIRQRRTRSSAA